MQGVAGAVNRSGSVVPAESTYNTWTEAVAISHLHVVVPARMMHLQAQHHEPVGMETRMREGQETNTMQAGSDVFLQSSCLFWEHLAELRQLASWCLWDVQTRNENSRRWLIKTINSNVYNAPILYDIVVNDLWNI